MATLEWSDYLAIVLYFVIVLGVGFWATFRKAKTDNAVGYFLAGRSMPWILVGASTFSTNIGAPMFVGIAGTAAASGIAVVMFEWHVGVAIIFTTLAMWMLILLGWLFLPVYMACGCYTMPQYLKMRYGGQRIRIWLAILHIFLTIVAQIAGQMYAGALFIQQIFEWDLYLSVALILAVTVVYTVIGGLTAVIWTDTIQTVILILGSTLLGIITMIDIGGFESMRNQYMQAAANYTFKDEGLYKNHTCGMPRDDAFHIFRDIDSDYPWPGLVGGLTILALNAWCTDQLCVQRSLSAKSVSHARAGLLLAAYLKILPFFFFLMPGMISRIYYPEEVACADPDACRRICENPSGCFDIAYPLLVTRVLPDGVRGIMLAALLAALMSSMTSMFNSSSTVFTMDIWRRLRPHAKESELMVVGRVYTIFLVGVAIAWLPILEEIKGSQFWNYSQSIASFILPPIVVTFLMGIFWTRTTEKGAFAGLVVGLIGGLIRMGLEWSIDPPHCGSGEENKQFEVVSAVHYLHFAIILAVVVFVVQFWVSLMTKPRPPKKLRRVTYWTRNTPELPELTESEDEPEEEKQESDAEYEIPSDFSGKFKHYFLRWVCGVEKGAKPPKLSKEERIRLQLKATSIKQDPFWKKVLDINAIICASVAVFIHAFWA